MNEPPSIDPFADSILQAMPPDVLASLTIEQIEAIQTALAASHPRAHHLVDVRFCVPLYWTRFYVVFLFGRDRRSRTRAVLVDRRNRTARALRLCFVLLVVFLVLLGAVVAVFFLIYKVKCLLGIDLFPDLHLRDILFPGD